MFVSLSSFLVMMTPLSYAITARSVAVLTLLDSGCYKARGGHHTASAKYITRRGKMKPLVFTLTVTTLMLTTIVHSSVIIKTVEGKADVVDHIDTGTDVGTTSRTIHVPKHGHGDGDCLEKCVGYKYKECSKCEYKLKCVYYCNKIYSYGYPGYGKCCRSAKVRVCKKYTCGKYCIGYKRICKHLKSHIKPYYPLPAPHKKYLFGKLFKKHGHH